MTTKFLNRVRMAVSGTPGNGTITLGAAATGYQSFAAAGASDGDQMPYVLDDGTPLGSVWEIGLGTYHGNNTFSRDTVTQSSAGGTTKISASAGSALSVALRGQDIPSPYSPPAPVTTPPTVVQYGTVQKTTAGAANVTLGAAPTMGNLLIGIGLSTASGLGGFYMPNADLQFLRNSAAYGVNAAIHSVRASESATQEIGNVSSGAFAGVLVELAGVDITRMSMELMSSTGMFGSSQTLVDALATVNGMSLLFEAQASGSLSISNPGTVQYNNDDGTTRLVFAYNVPGGGWNGIAGATAQTNGVYVINLPGVVT